MVTSSGMNLKDLYENVNDHRRDRTCNLLIRSQTRCHFARRPLADAKNDYMIMGRMVGLNPHETLKGCSLTAAPRPTGGGCLVSV